MLTQNKKFGRKNLFFIFIIFLHLLSKANLFVVRLVLGSVSLDTLNTTGAAATEGRNFSEADVTFAGLADHEGGGGDDLLADGDVALEDQAAGLVDGAGHTVLEDDGLEAAFENIRNSEGEDVIELVLGLFEEAEVVAAAENGVAFEDTAGVGLGEGEEETSGTTHLGEDDVDTPDLTLAAEAVLADEAELTVETFAFVGAAGSGGDAVEVAVVAHITIFVFVIIRIFSWCYFFILSKS